MNLSKQQQYILDNSKDKSIIIASAASGKTHILTEKVRQLLEICFDPSEIAVITFTNLAAQEMKERLGDDYQKGMYIGTIHGLANYFLLSHGYNTDEILDKEQFDKLFNLVQQHPDCVVHYKWIVIDEFQDSGLEEHKFIFDMIQPDHFFIVGDPKQSIYQFRGARPDLFFHITERRGVKTFYMNENYRNARKILYYAKNIIKSTGLEDNSIPIRDEDGIIIQEELNWINIANKIKRYGDYVNWAVLTRTNAQLLEAQRELTRFGIPCDSFKTKDLDKSELDKKMAANTVKVLTIHSSKGLEWNNVIINGMTLYNDIERNVGYVGVTRARDQLIITTKPRKKKIYQWG